MEWDKLSRSSVDLASSATSFAFSAAKKTTRFGFAVTRGITSTTVGLTTGLVDHAFFGGVPVTRPLAQGALSTALTVAEQLTMAPIFLSEYITSTSFLAAHSSINVLTVFFPGSSDASFSLASFLDLVKREWNEPAAGENLPQRQFGLTKVVQAIIAWGALQGVTQEMQEKRWFKHLKEIHVKNPPRDLESLRRRRGSRVRVTSDVIFPGNKAQIIAADIGEAPGIRAHSFFNTLSTRATKTKRPAFDVVTDLPPAKVLAHPRMSDKELKSTLRRLSKMVLAGYGGASFLFFGISPSAAHGAASRNSPAERAKEEQQLTNAIDAAEAQARGEFSDLDDVDATAGDKHYSWWDVLLGRHDHEIFERYANTPDDEKGKAQAAKVVQENMRATAVIGSEHLMPRFWVLTDHSRGQIVLVLRGTMSLNEIAVDLTCEPDFFEPAVTTHHHEDDDSPVPGKLPAIHFPSGSADETGSMRSSASSRRYHVHGGMLRMAKVMGGVGKPVQLAVHEALHHNPGYELAIAGHSLGAGVAAILGLTWADPKTCLTVESSGLPVGRHVSVYCFAPPSLFDAALCRLSSDLITSFVYSHDVVARLSLGSVRDLKNAAVWLCEANDTGGGSEGYSAITKKAKQWRAGKGKESMDWFTSVRKTLEANMQMADMFPPGRVLWAVRDNDLHPSHRTRGDHAEPDKLRLFDVLDVEQVFGQIVFAKDMLSAHMPHNYDRVLHDLL